MRHAIANDCQTLMVKCKHTKKKENKMTDFQIYLVIASAFYIGTALVGMYIDRKHWR